MLFQILQVHESFVALRTTVAWWLVCHRMAIVHMTVLEHLLTDLANILLECVLLYI